MNIPLPSRGDDILSWARTITTGVNAIGPISGRNMLVKNSANGFGFEPLPQNLRDNKRAALPVAWPWTFVCKVSEDPTTHEETRTGGWRNCRVQFGLEFRDVVTGVNTCADGDYYLKVRTLTGAMELIRVALNGTAPASDPANDTYYIWIGKVENAVQTDGIYWVPVIYINL